jgi:YidC/Oxa1 family membrane protein insertase
MKLYGKVGVNPLSGCIPMVLQMPVLLALFNFFPNSIELRQEAFLWANDLSTFDEPIRWSADIPLISWALDYHISMFTLLMTLSTLAYTYYNNQINTQAQGPMKSIGYLMPITFFFVLNSFSAGLTWYYFVSNLITISQQKLATSFIDKDKIRRTMEENKKNSETGKKKKSKFSQRIEEAMKMQDQQRKQEKGKK